MGKAKINAYAALLLIAIVGGGASMMIVNASNAAQEKSDAYYDSVTDEALGTTTARVFVHNTTVTKPTKQEQMLNGYK